MTARFLPPSILAGLCGVLLSLAPGIAVTQDPPPAATPEGMEVLARGPVHEAFASTAESATSGGPVIAKAPPEPIEELPPEQKPEGENVQWIPGYWGWDEERSDYLWVSGFWRNAPPNRVWVAGSWREAQGGFQWVPGFWQLVRVADAAQQAEEIEYLPPPPAPLEVGPSIAAPDDTSTYVPGCWVWRGKYVWRPGVWIGYRPGWVWTPARYCWSPAGYVFVDGYWDYPLDTRGVLFAPVYFSRPIYAAPTYVYSPTIVVAEPCLYGSLFVRRGWGSYYFGDYFDRRYVGLGYTPWTGLSVTVGPGGVNVGIGARPGFFHDPLWSYYRTAHRHNPAWAGGVRELYVGRYQGSILRPPHTLVQQRTVVNRIENKNITIVNQNAPNVVNNTMVNNITNVTMLSPITNVQRSVVNAGTVKTEQVKLQTMNRDVRVQEQASAKQLRQVGLERGKVERQIVTGGGPPKAATDAPRRATIAVPPPLVARARVQDEKKAPPPNPIVARPTPPKVEPKTPPVVPPKVNPPMPMPPKVQPKTPPVVPPKVNPPMPPKVEPKTPPVVPPKVNPPMPTPPKVEPKTPPVVPPKVNPPMPPKVEPKTPPVVPPKVNPPMPPGTPPKVNPPTPPGTPPKVNPPMPPKVQPTPQPPKVQSPKVQPPPQPPKVQPPPQPPKVQPPPQPPKVQPPPQPKVQPPPQPPKVQPPVVPPPQPPKASPPPKSAPTPKQPPKKDNTEPKKDR